MDDTRQTPVLDDDGLLRFGGRWVAVPDSQLGVVAALVRRHGHLVRHEELRDAYCQAGGSGTRESMRALRARLTRRFAAVGLTLHVVRNRGMVLETADDVRAG